MNVREEFEKFFMEQMSKVGFKYWGRKTTKQRMMMCFTAGRKSGLEGGEDVYRCVKCGAIYLDSPVSVCDCAHDAAEFRLCKLIDPIRQRAQEAAE